MSRHVVAAVQDIPPGSRKLVTVKERPIALFNVGGEFFALFNRCPHQGGSLCDGVMVGFADSDEPGRFHMSRMGEVVKCPWHGWEFDVRTGQSFCAPDSILVRSFRVSVEPGGGLVKGPYVAETFPVTIENDYVVVEV